MKMSSSGRLRAVDKAVDAYQARLTDVRNSTFAVVAASREAGRSRDWIQGFVVGSALRFPEEIQRATLAFFNEAWPVEGTGE